MDEAGFWNLVQAAHDQSQGDMDRKYRAIGNLIGKLSKADAADFQRHFDRKLHDAFDWRLWGAAYLINGGCSDDTFYDFRVSLISRGKAAYERAMADPDSLADDEPDEIAWFYEGYQYAITDAVLSVVGAQPLREPHPRAPRGEAFDEDAVASQYPRLAEKLGY